MADDLDDDSSTSSSSLSLTAGVAGGISPNSGANSEIFGVESASIGGESGGSKEPVRDIVSGKGYTWRDWSIARGRDCLYIWSDAAALELSNGSNGWFRFILDGKLATMYSSGSPEGGSDSSENRGRNERNRFYSNQICIAFKK